MQRNIKINIFIIVDEVFENLASGIFKHFKKLNKFTVR